jgi:hypothetical protein
VFAPALEDYAALARRHHFAPVITDIGSSCGSLVWCRPRANRVHRFAEHLPERRKMMQAWADYLDAL